ncbi:hypothetical protein [Vibrio alginolyticus]|uniref:hypothetical protein n=2 Tax=Vibrio alginolyticus TaxID=663 RepID=UPI0022776DB2|nr:hypothetical protein [Vibrio alginolyticus]EKL9828086.1 hypothetical protein [Vibrio alginolyticus]ELE6589750.1 hypothetical protein [Vibrio alginolyticus]WAE56207.1 hypothetical protein OPR71_14385 [Vibrio alginolyticus]
MNVTSLKSSSLILVIALLFPLFPTILPGTLGFQVVSVLLIFFTLLFLFSKGVFDKKSFLISFCFLFFALLFSIQGSLLDLYNGVFVTSDIFEIPKYISIFLVFCYFRMIRMTDEDIVGLVRCYLTITVLIIIYTYFEVLLTAFKPFAYFLYKRESKEILSNKAVGPFGITYHLAYFLLIPIFGFFSYAVISKKLKYWFLFFLSVGSILLTQSRTMFLTMIFGFMLLPFLYHSRKRTLMFSYLTFLSVLIPIVFSIVYMYWDILTQSFSYIYSGISGLYKNGIDFSGQGKGSANIRFAQLLWAYQNQFSLPIISAGIGKGEMMLESLYALYYYRFGIWGIALFFAFILYANSTLNFLMKNDRFDILSFYFGLKLFYLLSPIALLSSASQDSTRLMVVFYGLLAVILSRKKYLITNVKHHDN